MDNQTKQEAYKRMLSRHIRFTPKEFILSQATEELLKRKPWLRKYLQAYQNISGTRLPRRFSPLISGSLGQSGGWEIGRYPDVGWGVRGGLNW